MIGIFQNNNNQNSVVQEYLPTPQISSVGATTSIGIHSAAGAGLGFMFTKVGTV